MKICLTREQSEKLGLSVTGGPAIDSDGAVILPASGNIVRYDPRERTVEELLVEGAAGIVAVAATGDGRILALREGSLDAVFAGKLIALASIPGRGRRLSATAGDSYVLVDAAGGLHAILRYSYAARSFSTILETPDPVAAIDAVRGGCLLAGGDSVYKYFEPKEATDEGLLLRLCSVADAKLRSLAADPDSETVYFSDGDLTYAWVDGKVVILFPMGGDVAYRDRVLMVSNPELGQLVAIHAPARRAAAIAAGDEQSRLDSPGARRYPSVGSWASCPFTERGRVRVRDFLARPSRETRSVERDGAGLSSGIGPPARPKPAASAGRRPAGLRPRVKGGGALFMRAAEPA